MTNNYKAINKSLGAELRRIRKSNRWTAQEVVEKMNYDLSVQGLYNYELGSRPCPFPILVDICSAINVSVSSVVTASLINLDLPNWE